MLTGVEFVGASGLNSGVTREWGAAPNRGNTRIKLNFPGGGLNLRGTLDKRRGKGEVAKLIGHLKSVDTFCGKKSGDTISCRW